MYRQIRHVSKLKNLFFLFDKHHYSNPNLNLIFSCFSHNPAPLKDPRESGPSEESTKEDSPATSPKPSALPPKKTNPAAGIWVTSSGIYYFKLTQLSTQHQLLYSLLKELYRVSDIDAFHQLLLSLKLLIIHADCLEQANKEQKGFLIFTLEKLLVPSLWKLLGSAYCHLNELAVPLLIHTLVHESGQATFWTLLEKGICNHCCKYRLTEYIYDSSKIM